MRVRVRGVGRSRHMRPILEVEGVRQAGRLHETNMLHMEGLPETLE